MLTVTNTAGNYTWSYTLSDNTLADTDTVVDADADRGADDEVFENFSVDVTDWTGDHAILDTLNIAINDDGPTTITPTSLLRPNAAGGPFTGFLDADINIDDNVGADQPGRFRSRDYQRRSGRRDRKGSTANCDLWWSEHSLVSGQPGSPAGQLRINDRVGSGALPEVVPVVEEISASISGASAGVRLPSGSAAG